MHDDQARIVYTGLNFTDDKELFDSYKLTDKYFTYIAEYHARFGIDYELALATYRSLRADFIASITPQKLLSADFTSVLQEADFVLCSLIAERFNSVCADFDSQKLKNIMFENEEAFVVCERVPFYGSGIITADSKADAVLKELKPALYTFCTSKQDTLILDYVYAATFIPDACPEIV